MIRDKGSPYEVRCLRCDVSFPVETRRCVHCGGPTSSSDVVASPGAFAGPYTTAGASAQAPIGVESRGPLSWSRRRDAATGAVASPDPVAPGGGASDPGESPPSIGSALVRSFGSLFWIIALIGFSIVRSCSEG